MTDTETKTAAKAFDYIANSVSKRGEKSYFTPIGVAFKHTKGGGITVKFNALPIGDEMVLFEPSEKPE